MKVPGRELMIAVIWLAAIVAAFGAFYFLGRAGKERGPESLPLPREMPAPPADTDEDAVPPAAEEPGREARPPGADVTGRENSGVREPKRIFADLFDGESPPEWEPLGDSKTIVLERSDGALRVKGASGSVDWDLAGVRTRAYELDGFSASVAFKLVSQEGTGTKMFFLCAEDPDNAEAKAWVYFHPTRGAREAPGYAAMKEGGSAEGFEAPDGGKVFRRLQLTFARGKLAAFVDSRKILSCRMEFKKVRFSLGLKSPAEGEEVEALFDSFRVLDWPEKPFEP